MTLEEEYRLSCYEELTTLGNHNHIYLVKHKLSGEIFVKKVLSRFSLDVYKQLRDLQIPGIPIIHDLILENNSLILIEDYIHGQTLEQLLEEQTTLVYSDALAIMRKLCDVLKSLHTLTPPIIHRDLKLSNIILTSENLVYIVDFDTARYYESGQEQDTELLGTKEYAPPEQYGFGQSDARSDIYALGIIFNRLLTGFQTVEELKTALHDNISSDIGKPGFTLSSIHSDIPGFRTGKLWKMILAFFGYLSFLYCSMTSDFTNAKTGLPLTGLQLWHERFFVFLMLLSLIFYNFNYKNIRTRSFLGHSLPRII